MQKEDFVFLSINTTGCRPTLDKIFEIGLYYWNENDELTKWHRLINPEVEIPSSIQQLAEISAELMQQARSFKDIINELQSIIKNKIIVASNALFKSSFFKTQMKLVGLKWQSRWLCLNKLLRELSADYAELIADITVQQNDTFYATTAAQQTADIFNHLLNVVNPDVLCVTINKLSKRTSVPLNILPEALAKIPKAPGIYKFYGNDNTLLYIGKSVCLQERIKSHFTAASSDNKEMRIAQQIKHIDWLETAGELGALLQEARLVKQLMPIYNRKLRRYKGLFTLELLGKPNNYYRLQISPCQQNAQPELNLVYGLFRQKYKAEQMLLEIVKNYGFCGKLSGLEKGSGPCFYHQIKICKGACVKKESVADYNLRLQQTLVKLLYKSWPYTNAIAIKEICNKTQRHEYHIINQWCYLGTVEQEAELTKFITTTDKISFDLDIYHILTAYLNKYGDKAIICLK